MLIWIAALHCEAKPVIDHYKLKKSPSHHAFDLYQNDDMQCVISGLGKIATASATAWVAGINQHTPGMAWINIGIAGAAEYALGSAWWVNKISDRASGQSYFPVPVITADLPAAQCLTLDQPSSDYLPEMLFDMEASAYFSTATRFSSAELVHSIKVISDNLAQQTGRDKAAVSKLVHHHMLGLASFAQQLIALQQQRQARQISARDWSRVLACAHFTQTQQQQLRSTLGYLLQQEFELDKLLATSTGQPGSGAAMLAHFRELCLRHAGRL